MITIELLKGLEAAKFLEELGNWRIKYFREYPYLYEGILADERRYLGSLLQEEQALLVVCKAGENVVALSTALPLASDYEILASTEELCQQSGVAAKDYFYFGEILISPEYRGQGLASTIYQLQEDYALQLGYKSCCFLVVVRENHPLKPSNYRENDLIWAHLGYQKLNVFTNFEWPTIQPDGTTVNTHNKMVYWVKNLL